MGYVFEVLVGLLVLDVIFIGGGVIVFGVLDDCWVVFKFGGCLLVNVVIL